MTKESDNLVPRQEKPQFLSYFYDAGSSKQVEQTSSPRKRRVGVGLGMAARNSRKFETFDEGGGGGGGGRGNGKESQC